MLQRVLPARGLVLEIASGTGEHAVFFSRALPGLTWQPTDVDASARASVDAWAEAEGPETLRPAVALDVTARPWPVDAADAVVCINMIHISPPECTPALLQGAAVVLPRGAPLVLYGPFRVGGVHTSESNAAFDNWLKAQNPSFGIRNLDDVADMAAGAGFSTPETVEMPANNLTVVFRRG
ncbi:SAM-dependent methyltransferase [Caenispirillum salinarum AK4]|uniref:SAM-dependent methyltransferase n=1 Tax=Caenispirillum salinarum AK4 TaxID=1238182 RepID=K9GQC2_9PROT|nr:SAM-dependent methyltransferase [Caenispirillum salinarum AK4]